VAARSAQSRTPPKTCGNRDRSHRDSPPAGETSVRAGGEQREL
jgi:hypothetical protein